MPQYRVKAADGKVYDIEAPNEARADAWARARKPDEKYSGVESFGMGLAHGGTLGLVDEIAALPAYLTDEDYGDRLDRMRGYFKDAQAEDPVAFGAGEITGGMATALVPGGAAAKGLSLGQRALRGGATGGVTGATYGFNTGEGEQERLSGAVTGGAFGVGAGLVAPLAVEGVARGAKAIRKAVSGPAAPTRVAETIKRDQKQGKGLTDQQFQDAQAAGYPVTNIDRGGESTRALARSAANSSPEGREALSKVVGDRFEGEAGRWQEFLERYTGGRDTFALQEQLKNRARRANAPLYRRAYTDGDMPVWSEGLERLTGSDAVGAAMTRAVKTGRDRAVAQNMGGFNPRVNVTQDGRVVFQQTKQGSMVYPNLQYWDAVKQELDDMASSAFRQGNTKQGGVLAELTRQMRDELDTIVPSYKAARSTAAEFFGSEDALTAGANFARRGQSSRQAQAAFLKMSNPEKQLFRQGFASELIDRVNAPNVNRNVTNLFRSPEMRKKVHLAFGKQGAREFEARVYVERVMDMARQQVEGNSTTVRQLLEGGFAGGGGYSLVSGDFNPQNAALAALVGALTRRGVGMARAGISERSARQVALMLASDDPKMIDRGLKLVAHSDNMMEALRSVLDRPAAVGAAIGAN